MPFFLHKMTGEVWDPYGLIILYQKTLFCMQNNRWGQGPLDISNSGAYHAVFLAQNDRWGLGPIWSYNSVPKDAVLQPKTSDEGSDP